MIQQQQTHAWRRQTHLPTIVATLDLHSRRRDDAIARLMFFLSDTARKFRGGGGGPVWVSVVTGTGSHSEFGPVLRRAVQATLDRRRMNYILRPGGGAFAIDVTSGFELHGDDPSRRRDTKVNLSPRRACDDGLALLGRSPPLTSSPGFFLVGGELAGPLPSEVVTHDARRKKRAKSPDTEKTQQRKSSAPVMPGDKGEGGEKNQEPQLTVKSPVAEEEVGAWREEELEKAMALSIDEVNKVRLEEEDMERAMRLSMDEWGSQDSKGNKRGAGSSSGSKNDMEEAIRESLALLWKEEINKSSKTNGGVDILEELPLIGQEHPLTSIPATENEEPNMIEAALRLSLLEQTQGEGGDVVLYMPPKGKLCPPFRCSE